VGELADLGRTGAAAAADEPRPKRRHDGGNISGDGDLALIRPAKIRQGPLSSH